MTVYLTMLAISLFFASCAGRIRHETEYRKSYCVYAFLSFLPFFIVSAIRFEVGTDWPIYNDYFYYINEGTDKFKEPLYNLLNRFLYIFTENSQILFIVSAALILSFMFLAIYKQSMYIQFSIIVFFLTTIFFNSMNQLRQMIAMSIFMFASQYIWSRNWKKYFLWMLFAAGMHFSGWLYFPMYFIFGWKADLKKHLLVFGTALVGLPVMKAVLIKIVSLTPYAWYFESQFSTDDFSISGFVISFALFTLLEYYNYVVNKDKDKMFSFMVNMQFMSVLSLLCSDFIPQVARIAMVFEVLSILSIPKMMFLEKDRNRRITLYCIVVAVLLMKFIYEVYIGGILYVLPYKTIFSR